MFVVQIDGRFRQTMNSSRRSSPSRRAGPSLRPLKAAEAAADAPSEQIPEADVESYPKRRRIFLQKPPTLPTATPPLSSPLPKAMTSTM